jgi:hypothetical protein
MTIGRLGKGLLLGAVIGAAGALFALTPLGMAFEETVGLPSPSWSCRLSCVGLR